MKILGIHGAWSSSLSFNYLKSQIDPDQWTCVDYDYRDSWEDIINKGKNVINSPYVVVGHSLGGIIGLHNTADPLCKGIITLASPIAGLDLNIIQQYFSRTSLVGKIAKGGKEIKRVHQFEYEKPVLHLVANKGHNPFMFESNDGVVSIAAQTSWSCGNIVKISANHHEILLSNDTVTAINNFMLKFS